MKILRLILNVVVIGALVGIASADGQQCAGLFGAIAVGFAFCVFGDLLEFLEFSNFTDGLRRFLFWISVIFAMFCAFAASYQDLFPQPQDIHSIQDVLTHLGPYYSYNILERIIICGAMPGTVATLWLATLVDYFDAPRGFVPVLPIGGAIIGGVIGFAIQMLSALGNIVLIVAMFVVTIVGLVPLFKFYKRNGWIMASIGAPLPDNDDDYNNYKPSHSSTRSYSSGSSSSYGGSSYSSGSSDAEYEGNNQLDYYMDDIASDNSRSRNLPYDCSIRSDVSFSHYGDDAYFTVDFTIDTSCCSAENQREYDMMIRDAQSFQKEVMNDLFREGKSLINRLKQKYKGWPGVNFEVKLGNISEY